MYLTFEEYSTMGGTLESPIFDKWEFEVETIINWYTFNRLVSEDTISPTVKRLVFFLIDKLVENDKLKRNSLGNGANGVSGAIANQSNDGYSTTYNLINANDLLRSNKDDIESAISRYLSTEMNSLGRRLLYRGLYPGE